MNRFVRQLFRPARQGTVRNPEPAPKTRLGLENLEGRVVLSGNPLPDGISFASGVVYINCGAADDVAVVSQQGAQVNVTLDSTTHIPLIGGGSIPVTTHAKASYAAAGVTKVVFYGADGNDSFTNNTGIVSVALGQNGDDTLVGGTGDDKLDGGAGNDSLEGRGGNDTLIGGTGDDTYVFSGTGLGSDKITEAANADTDRLDFGKFGPNIFAIGNPPPGVTLNLGSTAAQVVSAGNLTLTLSDALGIEDVTGSAFADTVTGNGRDNVIAGGAGNDAIRGGDGNDSLSGDAGNDNLYGGHGNNMLNGGDGNDVLVSIGGGSHDVLTGGPGSDSFWADPIGVDTITDASAAEVAAHHVHRVAGFASYRFANGSVGVTVPVSTDLNGVNLSDPKSTNAAFTKKNFSGNPLFGPGGPVVDDIQQGDGNDCYFLSKLAAAAKINPDHVRQLVVDLGDGTYGVNLKSADGSDNFVRVDGDLWMKGSTTAFAHPAASGAIWVPILEKAWAFVRNQNSDYAAINGGNSPEVVDPTVAIGAAPENHPWTDFKVTKGAGYLAAIQADLNAGKAITVGGPWSLSSTSDVNAPQNFHRGQHIFMVEGLVTNANGKPTGIKLYDLFGGHRVIMGPDLIYTCSGGFQSFAY